MPRQRLAAEAKYSIKALAENCGVSVRVLERFPLLAFSDSPRGWLKRLRMQRAMELLRDGSNVKETAASLGYEDPSHFSSQFKECFGFAPKEYPNPAAQTAARPKMSHSAMKLSRLAMNS